MIFNELLEKLEAFAPAHLALEYDNTGYQIGRGDKEIGKICLAIDATPDVIAQAVGGGADLLIAHHPIIFRPMARVTDADFSGRRIISLIRADINFVALHTNFDVAHMGRVAADLLGLAERRVFEVSWVGAAAPIVDMGGPSSRESGPGTGELGIGCFGRLPRPMSLAAYAAHVRTVFALDSLRLYGDGDTLIGGVAISPGSAGANAAALARKAGVDLFITGEIKHSTALSLLSEGISVIEAGHFGTEKIFTPAMMEFFAGELPELEVFAAKEDNPFYVL